MPMIKTRLYSLKVYLIDKRENMAIQANVDRSFSYVLIGLQRTFKDQ